MSFDKTLTDLNRRDIRLTNYDVDFVIPSYFQDEYPKLVRLLKLYLDSLQEEDNAASDLYKLLFSRDITQVKESLLSFIGEEVLLSESYFENFRDKRTSIEFSNLLYRSKGTKYSIEQFFRIFFDVDVIVDYPKKDIMLVGDPARETVSYISKGLQSGINFSYEHDGVLSVILKSSSGNELILREDIDYVVDTGRKIVTILNDNVGSDPYLQSDLDFIFFGEEGFVKEGNEIILDILKDNSSLLGTEIQQKKIQNDKLFQLFSLAITTPLTKDIWSDAYEKFAHPAGMFYAAQIIILSQSSLNVGKQIFAVQDIIPKIVLSTSLIEESIHTDMTSIIYDSAVSESSDGFIRTFTDNNIDKFSSNQIIELGRQYPSIIDAINIKPPTMDIDSSGDPMLSRDSDSFIDTSNIFDLVDRNFYDDSDGSITIS